MPILDQSVLTTERELVVGFYDLTRYMAWAPERTPGQLLDLMAGYFDLTANLLAAAGGEFVKSIGDAGLAVFPADTSDGPDVAVAAFLALKRVGDDWLLAQGVDSEAQVRLHVGAVAVGRVAGRPDIYGETVNRAAMLRGGSFVVTDAVHARLGPGWRARFIAGPAVGAYLLKDGP